MGLDIKKIIQEYISPSDKSKLAEGTKRVKLSPRTMSELENITDIVWTAFKNQDDEPPKKGFIHVEGPKGSQANVPVYYLSELPAQGGVFPLDPNKPRNLYNSFIVINPDHALNPSRKSTYNILYHELQHLMDLSTTEYLTPKLQSKYSAEGEDESMYWGHEFEFRAYTNEILNSIYNEYKDLFGKYKKEELLDSMDSILKFFGQGGPMDEIGVKVFYNISSEELDSSLPNTIQVLILVRKYNRAKWTNFLKMLYSTVQELKAEIEKYYQEEVVQESRKRRKYSQTYCEKTPCHKMGFSQKASCRPYKNCYRS